MIASWDATPLLVPVTYIDQPVGTGFSYGMDTVKITGAATTFVRKAFQILLVFESKLFSNYGSREHVPWAPLPRLGYLIRQVHLCDWELRRLLRTQLRDLL